MRFVVLVLLLAAQGPPPLSPGDLTTWMDGRVAPLVPSAPSPANAAQVLSGPVTLAWSAIGGRTFTVCLSTSSSFPTNTCRPVTAPTWTTAALVADTLYYWRVTARNTFSGVTGPVWTFRTAVGPAPTPSPTPPPAGSDFGGYRPHLQGFGSETHGGSGGPVCTVTTLAIDGSRTFGATGDLADCVAARPSCLDTAATCARTVVFAVSGTSTGGAGQVVVDSPFLTVAGQTAPSGGFTLANARFLIDTHDVVIQHLRVRKPPMSLNAFSVGDAGDGQDNSHVFRVLVDHVSVSWATNVNNYLQAGPGSTAVMVTDSLIYEGLWDPPWGGIGVGIGGDTTFIRNVVAHHWSRQPIWGSPGRFIIANNVTYNGTDNTPSNDTLPAFYGDADGDGNAPGLAQGMILWNVLIKGPNSGNAHAVLGFSKKPGSVAAGSQYFLEGNTGPGTTGPNGDGQWVATVCGNYGVNYQNAATCGPSSNLRTNTPFPWWSALNMGTLTSNIRDTVLANAGARPKDRDTADTRVLADVVEGDGTHYLDWAYIQSHYGGMPVLPTQQRPVTLPANPSAAGACGTFRDGTPRTVLECFLESDPTFGAKRLEVWP